MNWNWNRHLEKVWMISVSIREDSGPGSSLSSSSVRMSPAVLFIIVILSVLFFFSGLLHLLLRFLIRHPPPWSSESRQLQQLFHLHDSGLDQAVLDSLPVFQYREIVGLKEPFDCAVCLCAFCEKDKLRLLPVCRHAFHISCIDTWLLSNSTCPLCREALFASGHPILYFDDLLQDAELPGNGDSTSSVIPSQQAIDVDELVVEKGSIPVRLGRLRKVSEEKSKGGETGETSSNNLDARRCYSMGSYQYVLGDSELRVTLNSTGERGTVTKGESYSVSKIWLWSKKGKFSSSSHVQMGTPSSLRMDI